jgi:transposase
MANSVKLWPLTCSERRVLAVKVNDRTLRVRVHRRYRVIAKVALGRPGVEVADRVGCHLSMAYEWIHRFNTSGFTTFERAPNPKGRPPIITGPQVRELIDIALSSPTERGLPFSAWTDPALAHTLTGSNWSPAKVVEHEPIRRSKPFTARHGH